MLKHYSGSLGDFDYKDTDFCMVYYDSACHLHYTGTETDGSKIKIPEGIIDCKYMFANSNIITPPVIPDSVKSCRSMFEGCHRLVTPPVIPERVEDCLNMFYDCYSLIYAPSVPVTAIDCDRMFVKCHSLQNYSLPPRHMFWMYDNSNPLLIEISAFVDNFKRTLKKRRNS